MESMGSPSGEERTDNWPSASFSSKTAKLPEKEDDQEDDGRRLLVKDLVRILVLLPFHYLPTRTRWL